MQVHFDGLDKRRVNWGAETQVFKLARKPTRISQERGVVLKDMSTKDGFDKETKESILKDHASLRSVYGSVIPPVRIIESKTQPGKFLLLQPEITGKSAFGETVLIDPKEREALRNIVDANVNQIYHIINSVLEGAPASDAVIMDLNSATNLLQEDNTGKFYYIDNDFESAKALHRFYREDGISAFDTTLERLFYLAVRSGMTLEELDPTGDFYGVYMRHPEIEQWGHLSQQEVLTRLRKLFQIWDGITNRELRNAA